MHADPIICPECCGLGFSWLIRYEKWIMIPCSRCLGSGKVSHYIDPKETLHYAKIRKPRKVK